MKAHLEAVIIPVWPGLYLIGCQYTRFGFKFWPILGFSLYRKRPHSKISVRALCGPGLNRPQPGIGLSSRFDFSFLVSVGITLYF